MSFHAGFLKFHAVGFLGCRPFLPITVDGKQYAAAGPDYNYGINCNSSRDNQIAAMCYIKWLDKRYVCKDYKQCHRYEHECKNAELPVDLSRLNPRFQTLLITHCAVLRVSAELPGKGQRGV